MRTSLVVAGLAVVLGSCTAPPVEVGWAALRNPVLGDDDRALKDAFLIRHAGRWHLGYSEISDDPFRFRLGFASTTDFATWVRGETIDQPETGGLASPTVVRAPDGRFVMTYNSHTRDVGNASSKLYYRTSSDLVSWSSPTRIHVEGADADADRLIDAAIAFTGAGAILFFKLDQTAQVARSASGSIDGPWQLLGDVTPGAIENYQPLRIDGRWHLLATSIPLLHRPNLYRLDGDETDPDSFRRWTLVRELAVEEQRWNTGRPLLYERANAAFLADAREEEGLFYLLYAGSTETQRFNGRGHARLGLARSRDLVTWEVPRERE